MVNFAPMKRKGLFWGTFGDAFGTLIKGGVRQKDLTNAASGFPAFEHDMMGRGATVNLQSQGEY